MIRRRQGQRLGRDEMLRVRLELRLRLKLNLRGISEN